MYIVVRLSEHPMRLQQDTASKKLYLREENTLIKPFWRRNCKGCLQLQKLFPLRGYGSLYFAIFLLKCSREVHASQSCLVFFRFASVRPQRILSASITLPTLRVICGFKYNRTYYSEHSTNISMIFSNPPSPKVVW